MIPTAATIARVLAQRGYDFEIAHIFAMEAHELNRLAGCESMSEAVAIVADMMTPSGIWAATDATPRLAPLGRPTLTPRTYALDARRAWLLT